MKDRSETAQAMTAQIKSTAPCLDKANFFIK